jgi:hypothetical protein
MPTVKGLAECEHASIADDAAQRLRTSVSAKILVYRSDGMHMAGSCPP